MLTKLVQHKCNCKTSLTEGTFIYLVSAVETEEAMMTLLDRRRWPVAGTLEEQGIVIIQSLNVKH